MEATAAKNFWVGRVVDDSAALGGKEQTASGAA